jgi:pimeloyl-ACP methyl ester carboxylesterase
MIKILFLVALVFVLIVLGLWLWTPDRNRAQLEARYAAGPGDFLRVSGLRLHLRDSGPRDAPAIIMLHGLGGSLHSWQDWAEGLDGDYRVVRFDLPGAGLSDPDPRGDYADERSLQVLAAVMDALSIESATLLGHSMGGRIAWRFAAREPARVERLVLVAPDGFASPGFEYGKAPEVPVSMKLMQYVLPKALLVMALKPAYADPAAMTEALQTRYYELMLAPGVRTAMIARMQQTVLQDPVPMLKTIAVPTLLIWGDSDGMIPVSNAADYQAAMPDVTLEIIAGSGHLPQEEAAAESLAVLRRFLDGSSR